MNALFDTNEYVEQGCDDWGM